MRRQIERSWRGGIVGEDLNPYLAVFSMVQV
jgi:hypothetical protein